MSRFCQVAGTLGDKLGALLFQLPPNLKKDLPLFDAFLAELPPRACAAFEFRHPSWLDDDVFGLLASRNLALCVADSEKLSTPVRITADYAYFRLRDEGYTPDDISRWAETIARETGRCRDVFVYFKHEEEGKGPEFAQAVDGASPRTLREQRTQSAQQAQMRPGLSGPARGEVHDLVLRPVAVVLSAISLADEAAVAAVAADVQRDVRDCR